MIFFHDIGEGTRRFGLLAARGVAIAAAIFTFAAAVLMIANYLQLATADPLDNRVLTSLREKYVSSEDPAAAEDIRALDLLARKAYFTRTWQLRTGSYLLLGGSFVLVVSLRLLFLLRQSPGLPEGSPAPEGRKISRVILVSVGAVFLVTAFTMSFLARSVGFSSTPDDAAAPGVAAGPAPPFPEEYEANWPAFRGPYGNARAPQSAGPTEWDGPTGENIRWQAPVPLPGFSSPAVWDDRVILTGANAKRQTVYCYNADDGSLIWERRIGPYPGSPETAPRVTDDTGYAAPSPTTDGSMIYAIFGTGDIAALDFDGNIVWGRSMGVPDNHYGHSSSLITYADTVIVLYDHGTSTGLYALDARDGAVRWKADRETEITWSSPVIAKIADEWAVLINANPYFAAYAAEDGREIYRFEGILGEVASSPGYDGGTVVVVNQIMSILGLDLRDGTLVWELYDDLPDTTSPLVVEPYFYIATSYGPVAATDISTGEVVWRAEFNEGFYASPVYAGGLVYLFDRSGRATVIEPASTYTEISSPVLGEAVDSTPAFADGRMYVRGDEHLYCIEAGNE